MTKKLNKGDTIAVISLSSGILGEEYSKLQLEMGIKNLNKLNLDVVFTPNALKGVEYLKNNPESKAFDLKWAFNNPKIKAILCAIGGLDTYKIIPYLLEDKEFIKSVKNNPKLFIGFSDSTINHLMFYKLGLNTIYGPSFMSDFTELSGNILQYTEKYFKYLFNNNDIEIKSSDVWYENRKSHDLESLRQNRISHLEKDGIIINSELNVVKGKLYGGCLESIYTLLEDKEIKKTLNKYNLLSIDNLKKCILFLESAESCKDLSDVKNKLLKLKEYHFFDVPEAIMFGKILEGNLYDFIDLVLDIIDENKTIVFNVNFGHTNPRCIIPYGETLIIDCKNKRLLIKRN